MRYTVIWHVSAQAELADLWSTSPDRQHITDAADRIDRILRNDPDLKGTSYPPGRILIELPLVAVFYIDEGDRKVYVTRVERA